MIILSHRGYWKTAEEKNTPAAFERSFSLAFGTETDFRDRAGELVIAHDPAGEDSLPANSFFAMYCQYAQDLPLALNIKADGLQKLLAAALAEYQIRNYFVFDMSIPDMLGYIKAGLNVFTRQSEYEPEPALYEQSQGVWIDAFHTDWVDEATLEKHLKNGKQVCIVSPDLHKRPYEEFWGKLAKMPITASSNIMLCTDYPEQAKEIFNG
jgi:glycerophosphoryl diester phosphodiesterase